MSSDSGREDESEKKALPGGDMKTYTEWHEEFYNGDWTDFEKQKAMIYPTMSTAEKIAWEILQDVTDRRGWSQEWDQFEDDIRNEIFATFVKIAEKGIAE